MMEDILCIILMLTGALLMLVAALGVLRLPDLYMRVSAATKASTLGIGLSLFALAAHFNELGTTSRALATIAFVVITSPVAAHLISRSAYLTGTPLWRKSIADELKAESRDGISPDPNAYENEPQ